MPTPDDPALSCSLPPMQPFYDLATFTRAAEEFGYESVFLSHIAARDSLTTAAGLAMITRRVRLGSGVAPLYHCSPASMAQRAATVDDISDGRFVLGLGVGHRTTMGGWHGQAIGDPVAEMREYVGIVRALLAGEEPQPGARWSTSFRFNGLVPRADLRIYQAALSPTMLRLAGEIADGVMLWACPPGYIREVVIPELALGRQRVGKSLEGFDVLAAIPSAITDDHDAAVDGVRAELHRYFGLPFYRKMFARAGYADDLVAYDAQSTLAGQKQAIGDGLIKHLAAVGSASDVRAVVQNYRDAGVTNPVISGVAGTDFLATLRGAAS